MDGDIHETAPTLEDLVDTDAARQSDSKDGDSATQGAERKEAQSEVDTDDVIDALPHQLSGSEAASLGQPLSHSGLASLDASSESPCGTLGDAQKSDKWLDVDDSLSRKTLDTECLQLSQRETLPNCAQSNPHNITVSASSAGVATPVSIHGCEHHKTLTFSDRSSIETPSAHDRQHVSDPAARSAPIRPSAHDEHDPPRKGSNATYGASSSVLRAMVRSSSSGSMANSHRWTLSSSLDSMLNFHGSFPSQSRITTSLGYVKNLATNVARKMGKRGRLRKLLSSRIGSSDSILDGRRSTIETSKQMMPDVASQEGYHDHKSARATFKSKRHRFNLLEVDGIESSGLILSGSPLDILVNRVGQVVAVTDLFAVPYLLCFENAHFFMSETDLSVVTLSAYFVVTVAAFFTSYVDVHTGKMVAYFPLIQNHVVRRITFWGDVLNLVFQLIYLLDRRPFFKYAQLVKYTRCWRILCTSGHFLGGVLWSTILLSLKETSSIICVLLVIIHNFGCVWWKIGGGRLVSVGYATMENPYLHSITETTLMMMGIATPKSLDWDKPVQLIYLNIIFVTGSMLMAWVFSQFVIIVQRLTMMESHTKSQLALVWSASKSLNIPQHLRTRITGFHRFKAFIKQHAHEELLAGLSRPLLLELKLFLLRHLVKSGAFFADLEPQIISELLLGFDEMCFSPGDLVIKKDDPSNAMYFIIRGVCKVMGDFQGPAVAHLMSGDFFGEMALLFPDSPRTAFVICDSYCMLASITVQAFQKVVEKEPKGVRDAVMRTLADFLRRRVPAHKSFEQKRSYGSDMLSSDETNSARSFGPKWTQNAKGWVGSVGHVLKDALTLRVGSRVERAPAPDVSGERRESTQVAGRDDTWSRSSADQEVGGMVSASPLRNSCPRVSEDVPLSPTRATLGVHCPSSTSSRVNDGMAAARLSVSSNMSSLYARQSSASARGTRSANAHNRSSTSNAVSARSSVCLNDTIQYSGVSKSSMTPNVDTQHLSTTHELDSAPLDRRYSNTAGSLPSGRSIPWEPQHNVDSTFWDAGSRANVAMGTNELLESISALAPSQRPTSQRRIDGDDPESALRNSLTRHISMENYTNYK
eukprot:GEMP01001279.1.p1 GENE.GEMP01001279.1~~GEMP01001279.1.p1  ORF type:complete len:1097 (+),score=208.66 GEMP01001279.1:105-3395(+)